MQLYYYYYLKKESSFTLSLISFSFVSKFVDLHADLNEMKHLEERITAMAPNMASIEEYRRKAENYLTRVSELNHITNILGEQRKLMEDAKSKRLSEFLDGFHAITNKLKEMYQMITQGSCSFVAVVVDGDELHWWCFIQLLISVLHIFQ